MSNGWSTKDVGLLGSYGASLTDSPASNEYPITAGGALNCAVKIVTASTTVGGGITAKLQTANGSDWVTTKTVSITGNGPFYIKLLATASGDQTHLPLLNKGRIVISTGVGSAVTIQSIEVLQEL